MAEPVTPTTPRPIRRGVLAQWWRHATFVHWAVDPDAVRHLLPAGVRSDLFDGAAYVGLVAFRMERTRVMASPPLPYFGSFAETNVRLYSVDEAGRRGVVFLSMDASRLVPVAFGRAILGLPYRWSRMSLARSGDRIAYTCRPGRFGPVSRLVVEAGDPIDWPSPLDLFLTARWGLHNRGRYLASEHAAWPLRRARLLSCQDKLVAAAGLPDVADEPPASVLYSPGVYARFGPVSNASGGPGEEGSRLSSPTPAGNDRRRVGRLAGGMTSRSRIVVPANRPNEASPIARKHMTVELNHTIVHSEDKQASAEFLAELLGLTTTRFGPFVQVTTANGVGLDYKTARKDDIVPQHYAFLVAEEEFDAAFAKIQTRGLTFWADPGHNREGEINRNDGGRGVYFLDPSGHNMELITVPYGGWPT